MGLEIESPTGVNGIKGTKAVNHQEPKSLLRQQFQRWLGIVILLAGVSVCIFVQKQETSINGSADVERKIPLAQCPEFCDARSNQLRRHHGGDLLDNRFLVLAVEKARDNLHNMLKQDYGEEAFKAMWVNEGSGKVIGEKACVSPDGISDRSYLKFRRKLQMKALQVQIRILAERKDVEGCDCTSSEPSRNRRLQRFVVLPEIRPFYERFIWATGGHSSAAGHGNLFNESYTAYMERGAKDAFRAIGIDFVGRNYAMGGMDSAPQIALCNEAIFGQDADVISWDFGMTDGKVHWKTTLFASRTGLHSNRPVHFSINNGGRNYKGRMAALKLAEDAGVPALQLHPAVEEAVFRGIPDSFGLSDEDLKKLGPYAQYFKCKGAVEGEEPCNTEKYNNNICPDRSYKAKWHPGWRAHATTGNILALFLTETLLDALKTLTPGDPRVLYAKLKEEEDAEYGQYFNSTIPDETEGPISTEQVAGGMKSQFFFRSKAVCKTALLPAQTRYLGILTESSEKGEVHGYFPGLERERATNNPPPQKDKANMSLVYEESARQQCPIDLNIDYKDYFYATQDWGWASLTFPNEAEIQTYAPNGFNPVGIVVICFYKCDWGRCPPGEVSVENFNIDWKMELNGDSISELSQIDQCFMIKSGNGYYHKPNSEGRYELRVWVAKSDSEPSRFARISSVIVL